MGPTLTRRRFVTAAAAASAYTAWSGALHGQSAALQLSGAHIDPAATDADRIHADADRALTRPVQPLTSLAKPPIALSPRTFYSTPDSVEGSSLAFTAHRTALRELQETVAALVAASLLPNPPDRPVLPYAERAAAHLRAWFLEESTAMRPDFEHATAVLTTERDAIHPQGVLDALPLAEIARAAVFLKPSLSSSTDDGRPQTNERGLTVEEFAALQRWFSDLAAWLNTSGTAGLARDRRDHTATAWLLLTTASAALAADDKTLEACRRRFRSVTLRAQIGADGLFPHELTSEFPFRNSLFNLDLLGATAELMTTPFTTVWPYELQDGPGLHVIYARAYPFLENRGAWPYPADKTGFRMVPLRRPSLVLAARAYERPEYAELWKKLPPPGPLLPAEIAATLPVKQLLLWTRRAPVMASPR